MKVSDCKNDRQLRVVYITAILVSVFYWLSPIYTTVDTATYQSAYYKLISGSIDGFRPPVYPIFIGGIYDLFGDVFGKYVIVLVQQLLFILSTGYFLKMLRYVLPDSKRIPLCATVFYAAYPGIASWPHSIMSEPFAILFTVFIAYWMVNIWVKGARLHNVAMLILFVTLAIFTRPAHLFIIPTILVFSLLLIFSKRIRDALTIAVSILIPTVMTLIYCGEIEQKYGIFSPSEIGTINQFWALRQGHVIQPDDISDTRLREDLISSYEAEKLDRYPYTISQHTICDWSFDMHEQYGAKNLEQAVKNAISRSPVDFIKDIVIRLTNASHKPISGWALKLPLQVEPVITALDFQFNFLYWVLAAYGIMLIIYLKKKKGIPVISITFYVMTLFFLATIILGAPRSYGRLFVPMIPIFIILVAQIFGILNISFKKRLILN